LLCNFTYNFYASNVSCSCEETENNIGKIAHKNREGLRLSLMRSNIMKSIPENRAPPDTVSCDGTRRNTWRRSRWVAVGTGLAPLPRPRSSPGFAPGRCRRDTSDRAGPVAEPGERAPAAHPRNRRHRRHRQRRRRRRRRHHHRRRDASSSSTLADLLSPDLAPHHHHSPPITAS